MAPIKEPPTWESMGYEAQIINTLKAEIAYLRSQLPKHHICTTPGSLTIPHMYPVIQLPLLAEVSAQYDQYAHPERNYHVRCRVKDDEQLEIRLGYYAGSSPRLVEQLGSMHVEVISHILKHFGQYSHGRVRQIQSAPIAVDFAEPKVQVEKQAFIREVSY